MNKELQYQFDLEIHRVYLYIPFKCSAQIWWRRKNKRTKIPTKKYIKISGHEQYFDVHQKLSISATCHYKNGRFDPKDTIVEIILFLENNSSKLGGNISLDVTTIIDASNPMANVSKRFQKQLEDCPAGQNPRITFTLSAHFVRECSNDSLADISFQATNGVAMFQKSQDMTFRPPSIDRDRQFRERDRGSFREQKISSGLMKYEEKQMPKGDRLEFSFNPIVNVQRERERKELLEKISDLTNQVQQKKKQIQKIRTSAKSYSDQQRTINAQKSLSLMNELNMANVSLQALKKQKADLLAMNSKLKDQNRQLTASFSRIKQEAAYERNEMASRYQQKKKQLEEVSTKIQIMHRQNDEFKAQIFKKQSQLITISDKLELAQKQINNKYQPMIAQLKKNFQEVNKHKTDIQKAKSQMDIKLFAEIQKRQSFQQSVKSMQMEFDREREMYRNKIQLLQRNKVQREEVLAQIEAEINHMRNDNNSMRTETMKVLKQKQDETQVIRQKLNLACRKIEQLTRNEQSNINLIKQLKVKAKNLEQACQNLQKEVTQRQKQVQQKQEIIKKAKEYINSKQQQLVQRDEFIKKAKDYIDAKQASFQTQKRSWQGKAKQAQGFEQNIQKYTQQIEYLKHEMHSKEESLQNCINEIQVRGNRIEDLERYIETIQSKLDIHQDQVEELVRKTRSQQQTLEDLIKKNLQMEIQLNVKNFELESIKGSK